MMPSTRQHAKTKRLSLGTRSLRVIVPLCAVMIALFGHADSDAATANQDVIQPPKLSWRLLRELNSQTGEMTPNLQGFLNGVVRMPGYMVPLEDNLEEVTEFLLVPTPGACIHVPPPPPNQIVYVVMDGGEKAKVRFWMEPLWVEGVIKVAEAKSRDGAISFFQLTGMRLLDYKEGR